MDQGKYWQINGNRDETFNKKNQERENQKQKIRDNLKLNNMEDKITNNKMR